MPSSSGAARTTSTKRACDACHRRKVRCNGTHPCENCVQADIPCTYNKLPQKKGPKGKKAKIITALRRPGSDQPGESSAAPFSFTSPLASPTFPSNPDFLTPELVEESISTFFDRIYTTLPIIHREWIQQKVVERHESLEAHCLVASLCAFMIIQPGIPPSIPPALSPGSTSSTSSMSRNSHVAVGLVEDIKRRRYALDSGANPNTASVLTSFFMSATLFGLERHKGAWYYLQEAILYARIMRIHDEKTYSQPETPVDIMNRRIFFILFVSERQGFRGNKICYNTNGAQALQKHRDLTLVEDPIQFPEPSEDPLEETAIPGLLCLHDLYDIVDSKMSEIWNNMRSQASVVWPPNTAAWLSRLQLDLTEAMPMLLQVTEVQEVDLKVTQLWLRCIVWQLSTASGCLSSTPASRSMSFSYPIEIARELVELTSRVTFDSMEAHGIGLVEKLFDIAFTLVDVMTVVPIETATFEAGPREHLAQLLYLVSSLRNGESRFVALLQAKIRESLPSLATSLSIPQPPTQNSNSGTDGTSYQESSNADSTPSSPYGSPPSTNQVMGPVPRRYPSLLAQSYATDASGMHQLNIVAPLRSPNVGDRSAPNSAVDAGNPFRLHFGGGAGPGAGYSG